MHCRLKRRICPFSDRRFVSRTERHGKKKKLIPKVLNDRLFSAIKRSSSETFKNGVGKCGSLLCLSNKKNKFLSKLELRIERIKIDLSRLIGNQLNFTRKITCKLPQKSNYFIFVPVPMIRTITSVCFAIRLLHTVLFDFYFHPENFLELLRKLRSNVFFFFEMATMQTSKLQLCFCPARLVFAVVPFLVRSRWQQQRRMELNYYFFFWSVTAYA